MDTCPVIRNPISFPTVRLQLHIMYMGRLLESMQHRVGGSCSLKAGPFVP